MNQEHLQQRLDVEIGERDAFRRHAEQQLAFHNGRIAMLEELLKQQDAPAAEPTPESSQA